MKIYDYKTGKPKTRGGIEAASKTYQKDSQHSNDKLLD
jgi:hypothetical protein